MPTNLRHTRLGGRFGTLYAATGGTPAAGGGASPLLTSLVSYWKLDEASGNATDSHSTNHLTDTNTVTTAAGKQGTARQFTSGNSEYFTIPTNASLETGDIDFTLAAWIYLDNPVANAGLLGKDVDATHRDFRIDTATGARFIVFDSGGGIVGIKDHGTALSISTWYFVVAWHDATANTVNIQLNDGAVQSAATTGVPGISTATFRLGTVPGVTEPFWNGRIDEAAYWKKVLSAAERTTLYGGGAGVTYPTFA